jgi:Uma2 family endonuclease
LEYRNAHPRTAFLVIEVADSAIAADRFTKRAIYARAGIPELWIIDLRNDVIELFARPVRRRARYAEVSTASRGETISVRALPDVTLAVSELLPPPARA